MPRLRLWQKLVKHLYRQVYRQTVNYMGKVLNFLCCVFKNHINVRFIYDKFIWATAIKLGQVCFDSMSKSSYHCIRYDWVCKAHWVVMKGTSSSTGWGKVAMARQGGLVGLPGSQS